MTQTDYTEIFAKKLTEQGYQSKMAEMVAKELMNVDNSLSMHVVSWLKDECEDFESHGYSITGLMKERNMTYPAALLTIDWLIKDPESAKKSLTRGIK